MILLIDNYDSFVYNLARYVSELGFIPKVVRNNEITLEQISQLDISHLIISPGPGNPDQAGISMAVIKSFAGKIPILGVCLGHQAIGQVYGAKITRALQPLHGKSSLLMHDAEGLFTGLPNPLQVAHYHSLIVSNDHFPAELVITARSNNGEIMALQHREFAVYGVQFHPESVLTDCGYDLLRNFLGGGTKSPSAFGTFPLKGEGN